jgi:glycosyltransferase involved in cell wall biosynthesis
VISVLLPYRDAATTLGEALESVLADLAQDDEVVAIDDGSRDDSTSVVSAIAARDRRVVAIASDGAAETNGLVRALSAGVAVARGELLARMDGDDISLPGRFAAQRATLESDPGLGAVGVQVEPFPAAAGGMQRYIAWQNALTSRAEHAHAIFVEAPLCHPSTMIRRAALDAVGGFRDVAWAVDYDLWLRLDAAGYGLAKVPRVLFRWRMSAASMTWTSPKNTPACFVAARAHFLASRLREQERAFAVWGAGKTGRRLARALEAHALAPCAFVDIDPEKIGRTARGRPIVDAAVAIERATNGEWLLVIAVGEAGARDEVRQRLARAGLVEGRAYVCAA